MPATELYVRARRRFEQMVKTANHILGRKKNTYVWDRVPFYRDMWQQAAGRHSLEFVTLDDDVWELQRNGACVARINNCYVELDDPVTLYVAGHKPLTYKLLEAAGLPVPAYAVFTLESLDTLRKFFRGHTGPFVIKPASGTGSGIGVSTHLYSWRQCLHAAALASLYGRQLVVERFVPGEVHRLLFVNGEFVNAVCRCGVRVVGDGHSSLEQLTKVEFAKHSEFGAYPGWDADLDLRATTLTQGLAADTVPSSGQKVLIKSVAAAYVDNLEVRTVYTHDVTRSVSDELIEETRTACRAVRSDFCGVDVITTDATRSLRAVGGVIGEVNTTPGLHHHYMLSGAAKGDDVVDAVLGLVVGAEVPHRER